MVQFPSGLAIWLHLFLYSNTKRDAAKWPIFFWDWQFGCISFCIRIQQEMQPNGQYSFGIGNLAACKSVFEYKKRCSQMVQILLGLAIWLQLKVYSNTKRDAATSPIPRNIGHLAASKSVFEYKKRCSHMAQILLGLVIWLHLKVYSNIKRDAAKSPIPKEYWPFGCI
jgi:hypothetical protein